jgi:hypothetical protein
MLDLSVQLLCFVGPGFEHCPCASVNVVCGFTNDAPAFLSGVLTRVTNLCLQERLVNLVSYAALSSSRSRDGCLPPKPQVLEPILKLLQDAPWGGIYVAAPTVDLLQMTLQTLKGRFLLDSLVSPRDIIHTLILKLLSSCGTPTVVLSPTLRARS